MNSHPFQRRRGLSFLTMNFHLLSVSFLPPLTSSPPAYGELPIGYKTSQQPTRIFSCSLRSFSFINRLISSLFFFANSLRMKIHSQSDKTSQSSSVQGFMGRRADVLYVCSIGIGSWSHKIVFGRFENSFRFPEFRNSVTIRKQPGLPTVLLLSILS